MILQVYLKEVSSGDWVAGCMALDIMAEAGTSRQALVSFANKLKRIKKEKLEEIFKCPNLK